jgi:hypothetical protein
VNNANTCVKVIPFPSMNPRNDGQGASACSLAFLCIGNPGRGVLNFLCRRPGAR